MCKTGMYRRFPYEDVKCKDNGDVYRDYLLPPYSEITLVQEILVQEIMEKVMEQETIDMLLKCLFRFIFSVFMLGVATMIVLVWLLVWLSSTMAGGIALLLTWIGLIVLGITALFWILTEDE